jgi:hypothetical protein
MGQQLVTDIVINLAGNLSNKARQYGQSMNQFAANNQRAMNMLKMSASAVGRGIDSIGNRYVALGAAVVGGSAVRGYSQLDRRISRIAIAADISREKSKDLYEEIQRVSNLKGIRIDPSEATAAIEEILTKTGDLDYAMANLPNIATVIQATGAGGLDVGGIFTELKKLGVEGGAAALKAIDTLNVQGKSGAFTLPGMAKEGPKIFAAYAATGRKGAEAVNELGAALQVFKGSIGTEAETVTAFEAVLRDLTKPETVQKLKQLSKGKISVFDPDELKNGKEVMQSLPKLMSQIVIQSKGLSGNLAELNLSDEAMRAFKPLISEFMNTGDVKSFEKFMKMQGDGTTTMNDAAVASADFAASIQLISNSWSQFSNQQLAAPIAELADAINSLDPDAVQNWLETGKNIALVVGGLVAVKKGVDAARWTKGVWDAAKPGKKGGALGGAMGALGATPVYVVNMPGGGLDLTPGGVPPGGSWKMPKWLMWGLRGGLITAEAAMIAEMAPDFSPVKINRTKGQTLGDTTIPTAPGFLDAWDEISAFFATNNQQAARPEKSALDIYLHSDGPVGATAKPRGIYQGLNINVDTGPSLMP